MRWAKHRKKGSDQDGDDEVWNLKRKITISILKFLTKRRSRKRGKGNSTTMIHHDTSLCLLFESLHHKSVDDCLISNWELITHSTNILNDSLVWFVPKKPRDANKWHWFERSMFTFYRWFSQGLFTGKPTVNSAKWRLWSSAYVIDFVVEFRACRYATFYRGTEQVEARWENATTIDVMKIKRQYSISCYVILSNSSSYNFPHISQVVDKSVIGKYSINT